MSTATHHAISDRQFASYKDPRRQPVEGASWNPAVGHKDPDFGPYRSRDSHLKWGTGGNDEVED